MTKTKSAVKRRSSLGNLIVEEGILPIEEAIKIIDAYPAKKPVLLRSQGFQIVRANIKVHPKSCRGRSEKVHTYSRQEILLEEIRLFAANKPMKVIGVVLILLEAGYSFREICPVELLDTIEEMGLGKMKLVEIKRILKKICCSDLFYEILNKKTVGLRKAYLLYR